MVLRCDKREDVLSIGERHEGCFFANQELLDEHLVPSIPNCTLFHHSMDCIVGLFERFTDKHTFACCEPIRLHDNGNVEVFES